MTKKPDPLDARLRQIAQRNAAPAKPQTPSEEKPPRAPRQPSFRQAVVFLQSGESLDVVLKNVSSTGAKLEFHRHVPLGERILIHAPSLGWRRRALVVWQQEGSAGVTFVKS